MVVSLFYNLTTKITSSWIKKTEQSKNRVSDLRIGQYEDLVD